MRVRVHCWFAPVLALVASMLVAVVPVQIALVQVVLAPVASPAAVAHGHDTRPS